MGVGGHCHEQPGTGDAKDCADNRPLRRSQLLYQDAQDKRDAQAETWDFVPEELRHVNRCMGMRQMFLCLSTPEQLFASV